jgi:hypothetical protein
VYASICEGSVCWIVKVDICEGKLCRSFSTRRRSIPEVAEVEAQLPTVLLI